MDKAAAVLPRATLTAVAEQSFFRENGRKDDCQN